MAPRYKIVGYCCGTEPADNEVGGFVRWNDHEAEVQSLRSELARAREALEWYANPKIYEPHPHGLAFDRRDLSYVARAALQPEGKP